VVRGTFIIALAWILHFVQNDGLGGVWVLVGGVVWKNTVPDESGTYDRMNPVFQLFILQLVSNLF
jgi:hypothetical protein